MRAKNKNLEKRKKILINLNSNSLNKDLLYYINEARSSPQDFSRHLMYDDNVGELIEQLSMFFKYKSKEVLPLIYDENLEKCSQDLLKKLISVDNGSSIIKLTKNEKENNTLKVRLKKLGLEPTFYKELIIVGTDIPIEAVANIFLKKKYRDILLNPKMNYIGITSGFLPSERVIIIIEIVQSLLIDNSNNYNKGCDSYMSPKKDNYLNNYQYPINDYFDYEENIENYDTNYNSNYKYKNKTFNYWYKDPHIKHYVPKREIIYNFNGEILKNFSFPEMSKIIFTDRNLNDSRSVNKSINTNNNYRFTFTPLNNNKKISFFNQKCMTPCGIKINYNNNLLRKKLDFAIPVSVCVERTTKNYNGNIIPFYSKKTTFDDGSVLIQPMNNI